MKITALLNEMNDSGQAKMNMPLDKDLIYKARNMFPGYDSQQALTLYMTAVKVDLFRQPVEQEQIDLFSENLDKIYESMLNSVIGLKYIK